jgi:Arc/MetJ-type ribon-helix-helix transcriptional regulator
MRYLFNEIRHRYHVTTSPRLAIFKLANTFLPPNPAFGSISSMQTAQKLSVSLDPAAMAFIDVYRQRHKAASRSQVVNVALHTLERLERERSLEAAYRLSSQDDAQLNAEFDGAAMDGLAHEAW